MADSVPEHIAPRRAQGGGRRLKKRKRNARKAQEIALINRDDYEEDSSGSESDEWYEGDEHPGPMRMVRSSHLLIRRCSKSVGNPLIG